MLSSSFHASIFAQKTKIYTNMATREQKNTISNLFKLRVAEELRDNPDKEFYALNEEKEIFKTKVLRRIIEDTQPPVNLWQGLWYQGEMACLFGEPNVGKTILAMHIASEIIKRDQRVLYFDFENAEHQLVPRYHDIEKKGNYAKYLEILTLNHANAHYMDKKHTLLDYIKRECIIKNVSCIIIDDITHLFTTGNPQDVRNVLHSLHALTKQLRISILVLAHSRKRGGNKLAHIEQLAGSFECAYSFDSIFSLNRANKYNAKVNGISHYIKQHKTRMGQLIYDDENVISLNMRFDEKTSSLNMCDFATGANERQLVRDFGFYTKEEIIKAILEFKEKCYTICEIAEVVGVSKSKVGRILQEHYKPHKPKHALTLTPLPPMPEEPLNPYNVLSYQIVEEGEEGLLYDDDQPRSFTSYFPPIEPDSISQTEEISQISQNSTTSQPSQPPSITSYPETSLHSSKQITGSTKLDNSIIKKGVSQG